MSEYIPRGIYRSIPVYTVPGRLHLYGGCWNLVLPIYQTGATSRRVPSPALRSVLPARMDCLTGPSCDARVPCSPQSWPRSCLTTPIPAWQRSLAHIECCMQCTEYMNRFLSCIPPSMPPLPSEHEPFVRHETHSRANLNLRGRLHAVLD